VSRVHAALERVGHDWVLTDDGLSQNGTFLNGRRLLSRRRLVDGDHIGIGRTTIVFHDAATEAASTETELDIEPRLAEQLTPGQRAALVALCRPFQRSQIAGPATNQQIAEELGVTLDSVKSTLRGLFALFGLEDLPQNQKRASLALEALRSGIVTQPELRSSRAPAAGRSPRGT
jgi:pSer/pThr/pTyr-binding forkhead associated (FHA) protein